MQLACMHCLLVIIGVMVGTKAPLLYNATKTVSLTPKKLLPCFFCCRLCTVWVCAADGVRALCRTWRTLSLVMRRLLLMTSKRQKTTSTVLRNSMGTTCQSGWIGDHSKAFSEVDLETMAPPNSLLRSLKIRVFTDRPATMSFF